MPSKVREYAADQRQHMLAALEGLLAPAMGIRLTPRRSTRTRPPLFVTIEWLIAYPLVWGLIAFLLPSYGPSQPQLVSLLCWGACYFAAGIYLSHAATARILETARLDILPHVSEEYAAAVAADIERRDHRGWLIVLPLAVAAISVPVALYTVGLGLKPPVAATGRFYSGELLIFAISYFVYFYAAAAAVVAARFHSVFAGQLHLEASRFYVLRAADSPLVRGLAKLSGQVLAFWAMIFLAIVSIMLLALVPGAYRVPLNSPLLSVLVPVTGFFSLGLGTLVYLRTEANIRATLNRFTAAQVRPLQERSNLLLRPVDGLIPADPAEVERLAQWQERILAGGQYGSRAGAGLSIALPLIMPAATLILQLFGWTGG